MKRRPEALKRDRELYEAMNFLPWLIDGLVARRVAGHQHLVVERVTRRVLESNVVEDRTITLLSNIDCHLLVKLHLRWSLLLVLFFPGRA